jgi:ABC-type transport system substrate-binding protein
MKRLRWLALVAALALVVAACGSSTSDETTTTAAEQTETTAAPDGATTSVAADAGFEGLALNSGGCGSDLGYTDDEGNPVTYTGKLDTLTALDEHTVEFALCQPDPAFLAEIAFGVFGIQPSEHLEATGGAPLDNPIGTGPYSLNAWNRGDSIVFDANPDYWGQVPTHDTLVIKWSTESAQRLLELQAGTAHGITFPGVADLPVIEDDPNLELVQKVEPNIFYIGMTVTHAPFDNELVRQAVAQGIDRQRIVDTFYPAGSETADFFTPCTLTNACNGEKWYDFDVDVAKGLMEEAGFADGFETVIRYRQVDRGYLPTPADVAADIQAQLLENLNITATIEEVESSQFIDESNQGLYDGLHLLGWTGDYPHVTNFMDGHLGASITQFGAPFDDIAGPLAEAAATADADAAAPLYEQANNGLKQHVPLIPISHSGAFFGAQAGIAGVHAPPWGHPQFNLWDNGEDTLVFFQNAEPGSLYCADETDGESLRPCGQVVEALYGYTPEGEVRPALATECVPNAELTVYTCSLREGVTFHDGSAFDANDVVVSYAAGLDAESPLHVGTTGSWVYYDYIFGLINKPEPTE